MMFRLQEQFEITPMKTSLSRGNDLTYMMTLLWCVQNGSIGFENEEDGNCKFIYRGNINLLDDVKLIENKKPTDKISAALV
jgi:hypothetical protein